MDWFGNAVDIRGDTAVVSAVEDNNENNPDAGSAYVFVRSGVTWSQRAKIIAPTSGGFRYGSSVSLDTDTLLIGEAPTGAGSVYRYSLPIATISRQPFASSAISGDQSACFSLIATGEPPLSYSWRRNGVALADGPALGGGTIIGADTAALIINPAGGEDAGAYDCIVTDACGTSLTSNPAVLSLVAPPAPCNGDANGNGIVNFADITEVLSSLGASCP